MESVAAISPTALLELVAAVGGSYAFLKLVGPFLYDECFSNPTDDDLLEAGLFPTVNERSPLLRNSPRPDSLRLAAQLYSAHLDEYVRRSSNTASSASSMAIQTPATGLNTPASTAPSTPISDSSSYIDFKHPPLYVSDVSQAIERQSRRSRRNSAEMPRANFSSAFSMTPADRDSVKPPVFTPLTRKFNNPGSRQKPISDELSYITATLICLLHCPDLNNFFLSGRYLKEEVEDEQHQAVINAFAATANYFWPLETTERVPAPQLDLSIFQSLMKQAALTSSSSMTLSSSAMSRPPSPVSSSPSTLVNSATSLSGAQNVSSLLRSLHVALNQGEYAAGEPTYVRTPYRLGKGKQADPFADTTTSEPGAGLRRHIGFLQNMNQIQEDSIVRDLFEGFCCVKYRCGGCDETVVVFDSFLVLDLPPQTQQNRRTTLSHLLKAYERPKSTSLQYCDHCRTFQPQVESRKIWSLPTVLIIQLPPNETTTAVPSLASSARTNGAMTPPPMARPTPTREYSFSKGGEIDYPIEGLNMAGFNGERERAAPTATQPLSIPAGRRASSQDECDLSSESGRSNDGNDAEEFYDLFAVRECVRGARFRTYAKDPVEKGVWSSFDAAIGVGRAVKDMRDIVTPNADLLFYRRRGQ